MFSLFFHNSKFPAGLDISDRALRLLQLEKGRGRPRISAFSKIKLSENSIIDGEIKNKAEVSEAIKKMINAPIFGKFSTNEVAASLPETKTFIKLLKIENSAGSESAIENEIERQIPLRIDEIYYDTQIISRDLQYAYVLIGAAPKNIVNDYAEVITDAGLCPTALEIEAVALARSLLSEESKNHVGIKDFNYGIIDFGAQRTSMSIYSKNSLLFSASIPVSGIQITQTIAEKLEISEEQAEKAKIICGLDDEKAQGVVKKILSEHIDELTSKIRQVIDYFLEYYPERGPLNRIILSGGGANIKNLDRLISQELLVETVQGNCLWNIHPLSQGELSSIYASLNGKTQKNPHTGSILPAQLNLETAYATVLGLALREIISEE
jgi:type IV pilus assembly protein PilM